MERLIAIAIALTVALLPSLAVATALETHKTQVARSPQALVAPLPDGLIQSISDGGTIFVGYAGLETPPSLVTFVADLFGPAATSSLNANAPSNINVALVPTQGGTVAQMMIHGSAASAPSLYQAVFGASVPGDATVLLSEAGATPCGGQLVLERPIATTAATDLYAEQLRARGFLVGQTTDVDGTLILANGTPCSAIVFIQSDRTAPGRSTIVVRYLED